jgi:hypothetical protein
MSTHQGNTCESNKLKALEADKAEILGNCEFHDFFTDRSERS